MSVVKFLRPTAEQRQAQAEARLEALWTEEEELMKLKQYATIRLGAISREILEINGFREVAK